MNITVLMGGTSSERDVSLSSGIRIAQALRELGHEVISLDPARGVIGEDEEAAMREAVVVGDDTDAVGTRGGRQPSSTP